MAWDYSRPSLSPSVSQHLNNLLETRARSSRAFHSVFLNLFSKWSCKIHGKVCLCTKNSTTIYCNQTLCIGRDTWGALCVLPLRAEIAVNTFPLTSQQWQTLIFSRAVSTVQRFPTERSTMLPSQLHIYNWQPVRKLTWFYQNFHFCGVCHVVFLNLSLGSLDAQKAEVWLQFGFPVYFSLHLK